MFKDNRPSKDSKPTAESNEPATANRGMSSKRLRWKMQGIGQELMTITPALAEEMLAYNTKNRPLSESVAKKYADQMRRGSWRLTRLPIIFSKSGVLQDGQKRLRACVISGAAFQAYVAFGEPDENFAFIDIGQRRTAADIFAIHGVAHYAGIAAASRWVMAYERGVMTAGVGGLGFNPTADELHAFYLEHVRLQDSVPIMGMFAASKLAAPSMMGALHYVCAQKSRSKADEMFERVATGIGFSNKAEPAYKLHKKLIDNLAAAAKLRPILIAAITIKVWNAERDGRDIGNLRWRGEANPDEPFPKVR